MAAGHDLALLDVRTLNYEVLVSTRTTPDIVAYDLLKKAYYWVCDEKHLHVYIPGKDEMLLYPGEALGDRSVWNRSSKFWAHKSWTKALEGRSRLKGSTAAFSP